LLRAFTDVFSTPDRPGGCPVLLGALNCTRATDETHESLRSIRQQPPILIRQRLKRAADEGELPQSVDVGAIASFCTTVPHGLALCARDGAPRETLHAAIDGAMGAWKALTAPTKSTSTVTPKYAARRGASKARACISPSSSTRTSTRASR
jgi:hypothetical protein